MMEIILNYEPVMSPATTDLIFIHMLSLSLSLSTENSRIS